MRVKQFGVVALPRQLRGPPVKKSLTIISPAQPRPSRTSSLEKPKPLGSGGGAPGDEHVLTVVRRAMFCAGPDPGQRLKGRSLGWIAASSTPRRQGPALFFDAFRGVNPYDPGYLPRDGVRAIWEPAAPPRGGHPCRACLVPDSGQAGLNRRRRRIGGTYNEPGMTRPPLPPIATLRGLRCAWNYFHGHEQTKLKEAGTSDVKFGELLGRLDCFTIIHTSFQCDQSIRMAQTMAC
jgi:hypothetical protein